MGGLLGGGSSRGGDFLVGAPSVGAPLVGGTSRWGRLLVGAPLGGDASQWGHSQRGTLYDTHRKIDGLRKAFMSSPVQLEAKGVFRFYFLLDPERHEHPTCSTGHD